MPTGKEAFSAVKYLGEFLLKNKVVGEVVVEDDNVPDDEDRVGGAMRMEQAGWKEQDLVTESSAEEVEQSQDVEEEEEIAGINWELRRRRRK